MRPRAADIAGCDRCGQWKGNWGMVKQSASLNSPGSCARDYKLVWQMESDPQILLRHTDTCLNASLSDVYFSFYCLNQWHRFTGSDMIYCWRSTLGMRSRSFIAHKKLHIFIETAKSMNDMWEEETRMRTLSFALAWFIVPVFVIGGKWICNSLNELQRCGLRRCCLSRHATGTTGYCFSK